MELIRPHLMRQDQVEVLRMKYDVEALSGEDYNELRTLAEQEVYKAACRAAVEELVVETFEDAFDQATYDTAGRWTTDENGLRKESDITDLHPLACDLVTFVLWLRKNTDYFEGPELDIRFPQHDSKDFVEVLADLSLVYTGE